MLKAEGGTHQLPGRHGGNKDGEAIAVRTSDDSAEVGSLDFALTETHNVPLVSLEQPSYLPLLAKITKGGRDGFDIVAAFIFQARWFLQVP